MTAQAVNDCTTAYRAKLSMQSGTFKLEQTHCAYAIRQPLMHLPAASLLTKDSKHSMNVFNGSVYIRSSLCDVKPWGGWAVQPRWLGEQAARPECVRRHNSSMACRYVCEWEKMRSTLQKLMAGKILTGTFAVHLASAA